MRRRKLLGQEKYKGEVIGPACAYGSGPNQTVLGDSFIKTFTWATSKVTAVTTSWPTKACQYGSSYITNMEYQALTMIGVTTEEDILNP